MFSLSVGVVFALTFAFAFASWNVNYTLHLEEADMSKTFFYFAYGSNLLSKRIHINNPSATRAGIGKLEHYRLDFITYSSRWKGASATIVPMENSHVWGAIWEIDNQHLDSLDRQEGVKDKLYFPMFVDIILPDESTKSCRVYQQTATPAHVPNWIEFPPERKPSAVYLNTILFGAQESKLPEEYQDFLQTIPHNGYDGKVDIDLDLSIVN